MKKKISLERSVWHQRWGLPVIIILIVTALAMYALGASVGFPHKGQDIIQPVDATTFQGLTASELIDELGRIPTGTILPVCDAGYRGQKFLLEGGVGVADDVYVCIQKADGTYGWQIL